MRGTLRRYLIAATILAASAAGAGTAYAHTIQVLGDIATSETWTADNEYILTQPIYVTGGATLTIEAGTVVRGEPAAGPGTNDPGALIITRGSKIMAVGTAMAPIVFTDLLDDNVRKSPGTFPYDRLENALSLTGQWGGVILLGRSYVANNTLAGPNAAREVQIEGLTAAGGLGFYGNGGNDDDDSGVMQFVSIRYGGFNLSANNEINGLTLGGVGRTTVLDYIEVFQNKDDGVEFFGGAANIKHVIVANGGDDGVDYDEGFRGKGQFILELQGTPGADKSDKGAEQDGGNAPDGSQPFATPMFYNATLLGLGQKAYTGKALNTALHFRDNAGGRWYNSFFADFGGAPMCIEGATSPGSSTGANTSGERSITPYVVTPLLFPGPDSDMQLELQDNTFWCFGNGGVVPAGDASASGCDAGKNHHDNGALTTAALENAYIACTDPLPIGALTRTDNGLPAVPDPITLLDPRPAPGSALLTTNNVPPVDGFFEAAAYRGAFDGTTNWAANWTTLSRVGYFPSLASGTQIPVSADISLSETWTADNEYILTQPIYVTGGATLTIEAGTVVRGEPAAGPGTNDPGALIITRGSKIMAVGTAMAPIVFTDLLDDNVRKSPGTFPYDRLENALSLTGQWGGVILLGRSYVANNTLAGPNAAREVQIEGLTAAGGLGFYGNGGNDDDDSGVMQFVSIRYGGFNLSANNEINGLTLGGVGRTTVLDYIEVFQNKDDGVEFFGGAANIKHVIVANGGDDGVDYDEGFRGKGQFILELQGTPGADKSDKGAEQDGGNAPDGSQPFATPMFYNATLLGLGQKAYTGKALNTALHFRDNAGGRWYNSFFADFGGAPMCIEGATSPGSSTGANTSGERSITPYVVTPLLFPGPDSDMQLELQDNTFWCFGNGGVVPAGDASASGCDAGKNHHDNGALTTAALENAYIACTDPLPIGALTRTDNGLPAVPDPITLLDPRPAPGSALLTTNNVPPVDGFFKPAPFRGAFAPDRNWAAGWTALARTGYFPTCAATGTTVPDEIEALGYDLSATPLLTWCSTPAAAGGETYDLVRSESPSDWSLSVCVESNTTNLSSNDVDLPVLDGTYFYVVIEENGCGRGSSGSASDGTPRVVPDC